MYSDVEKPITAPDVRKRKGGERLVMVTAYDTTMARLVESATDMILVGDSLACVVRGEETTLSVTLEEMVYHSRMVVRGAKHPLVIGDMPFGSYQVCPEDGLRSAIRLVKEAGVGAVKLEGGLRVRETIARIVDAGIPVMGHVGLTPQSFHALGGHKIQGKSSRAADQVMADAQAVEAAGAFALVLEGIPNELAEFITQTVSIPTIGIGAGAACDGQVLVINDMIGLNAQTAPMRFNKEYCSVREIIREAVSSFAKDVREGAFPTAAHGWSMPKALPRASGKAPRLKIA